MISDYNSKLYPITRQVLNTNTKCQKHSFTTQVRKRYFTNVDMESEEEFRPKFVEFLTDLMYSRCTDQFARLLVNHSVPTYEYSFEYRGQYSIVNLQGEQVSPNFLAWMPWILKSCNVCFPFSLSRIDYLSQCSLESLPVCLSPEEGQFQFNQSVRKYL